MKLNKFLFFVLLFSILTLNVLASECNLTVNPMSFGSYPSIRGLSPESIGSINVKCNNGIPFRIMMGPSAFSGNLSNRLMTNQSGRGEILYNLYLDSAHTKIWGDGTGNTFTFISRALNNYYHIPVYGLIYPRQNVPPGRYIDTLTVILEW